MRGPSLCQLRQRPRCRQAAAAMLGKRHVDRVWASPLERAKGHHHGDDLREPLHHNTDLHDYGSQV